MQWEHLVPTQSETFIMFLPLTIQILPFHALAAH